MCDKQLHFNICRDSSQPLYIQLKEQLLRHIYVTEMAPGTKLPDIYTLSRLSGLSVKCVNSALNELIRDNICVRRPKKGTFVAMPEQAVSSGARICLLYHGHTMNLLAKDALREGIRNGVYAGCREHGIQVVTVTGVATTAIERYAADHTVEIAGVIILDDIGCEKLNRLAQVFPRLRFFYFNDISADFAYSPRNVYGIFHDDFSGGYLVGRHVARYGLDSIGMVGMNVDGDTYKLRASGFTQALAEAHYDIGSQLHEFWRKNKVCGFEALRRQGREAARHFLKMKNGRPQLYFIVNDVIASGFAEYWGRHNPEEKCHIFGYDNIMPRMSLQYNFSTVDINYLRMGKCVAEVIAKAVCIPKFIFTPPQLICRADLPFKA